MSETFSPPGETNISPGSEITKKPRTLVSEFGDGFLQRVGDGINTIKEKVAVIINDLTPAEADEVDQFFTRHGGYKFFYWTAPGKQKPKKYICVEWAYAYQTPHFCGVRANFEEVFDP